MGIIQPGKINSSVMRIFKNNTDEKYISGINLWEISIKYALGKLELYGVTPDQDRPNCS